VKTTLPFFLLFLALSLSSRADQPLLKNSAAAPKEAPLINSLGMRFQPIPGTRVLFCIHPTRKGDYRIYAASNPGVDVSWKDVKREGVPVSQADDHPVVMVAWREAKAFCAWLSRKEGRNYRLPTDHEWSVAVGIGDLEKATTTPSSKDGQIPDLFPWGRQWPPPKGAGNFADVATRLKLPNWTIIEGYEDGFATTSPVMSFAPNPQGLYDVVGNVWQWCEDWFDAQKTRRVLRGGSWYADDREGLLSSSRGRADPEQRSDNSGFRVVLAP
jgi:formylglycine-generating enzyme required for sulfatase activity